MSLQKVQQTTLGAVQPSKTLVSGIQQSNGPVQNAYTEVFNPKVPQPVSLELTAIGADRVFAIGDPTGMIAALNGITSVLPTSFSSGITGDQFNALIANRALVIGQMNYVVENSTAQFSQPFTEAMADIDGTKKAIVMNLAPFTRSDEFNPKVKTLNVNKILNSTNALFLKVKQDETVTLTLTFVASVGQ